MIHQYLSFFPTDIFIIMFLAKSDLFMEEFPAKKFSFIKAVFW